MFIIMQNWHELVAYFTVAELETKGEAARPKARMIKEMLNDQTNWLFFHFATPVVCEFERVNAAFQTSKPDGNELLNLLDCHHR